MSEKPQQEPDVSSRMSEAQSMLNEITDRTMPPSPEAPEDRNAPGGEKNVSRETRRGEMRSDSERPDGHSSSRSFAPPFPTEPTDGSAGTPSGPAEPPTETPASPPPLKNKPSSAYAYLAVLFGAAFLMLLLAYFVQQRNNAAVRDDLRLTTASREELLEDIQRLEEENQSLQEEKQKLDQALSEERTRGGQLERDAQQNKSDLLQMTAWYSQANLLSCLERCADTGDYLLMGAIVQGIDPDFNRQHPDFSNEYLIPAQEARYLELREELFQKGGIMVMERRTLPDGSESAEFPMVAEGAVDQGVFKTAVDLYAIVRDYPIDPEYAARCIALDFQPNSGNLEILHSRAFKKSTVEWFEQIKADLIAQDLLAEQNGELTLVNP